MTFAFTPETFFGGFLVVIVLVFCTMMAFLLKHWGDCEYPEYPLVLRILIPLLRTIAGIVAFILLMFLLGNIGGWLLGYNR